MRRRLLVPALAGLLFLFAVPPSHAQETQPGQACAVANRSINVGGPENPGAGMHLVCDGSVWRRVEEWDTSGNLGVKQAAPKAPLHVGGEAIIGQSTGLACDANRTGAIRYNSTSGGRIDFCNGTAWANVGSAGASAASPDRGIQFNSGGSFAASSGLVFTSAENLGIGTASPVARLDVLGASSSTAADAPLALKVTGGVNTSSGKAGGVQIVGGAGSIFAGDVSIAAGTSGGGTGGTLTLSSGYRDTGSSASSAASIVATGSTYEGTGGAIAIAGGMGFNNDKLGGTVTVAGGDGSGSYATGGKIVLGPGDSQVGNGGSVTINGGSKYTGSDGDVVVANLRGNLGVKQAAPKAPLHVGGEAIIGAPTGLACDANRAGALRYYSTGANCIQFCNGTSWACMADATCDNAPAFFPFTAQSNLATSTQFSSNIAAITGMDGGCSAIVSVSGQGSPEYRVCSTSNCSGVDINWTTANNSVAMQGKYIQVRATTSASAGTTHTATVSIGPVDSNFQITTTYADCTLAPVGTVCGDGTVYAGTSPDGGAMFATRCDFGQAWDGSACTGARSGPTWDNAGGGWTDTPVPNCASAAGCDPSGEGNTAALVLTDADIVAAGFQNHTAAKSCADLSIHGNSDWYLPSIPEVAILYSNRVAIGNLVAGYVWTSSEADNVYGWSRNLNDGTEAVSYKNYTSYLRCVRRDVDVTPASLSFTDQTGLAAAALTNSNIFQITGIASTAKVYLIPAVGDAPQYRVCSDASCSSVLVNWTAVGGESIGNNQYVQLRTYASGEASGVRNVTLVVGDTSDVWSLTTASGNPCSGSPNPGAVCTDGTVYAGVSPDGSVAMYLARCDAGQTWDGVACTGTRTGITWNDGNGSYVDTTLANCGSAPACDPSGETNTTTLAAADANSSVGGTQPHAAAKYCDDLVLHGSSDWYLPSAPELSVTYGNRMAIGWLHVSGSSYWSSSESDTPAAWYQAFSNGAWGGGYGKNMSMIVRCARR